MKLLSEAEVQTVQDLLIKQLNVQASQVVASARIQADLGADSLDVMEIILAVEERFSVSIPDEVAERVITVEDLMKTLSELLGSRAEEPQTRGT